MTDEPKNRLGADAGMRRVVTINGTDGKSGLHDNHLAPRVDRYTHIPGMSTSILWATTANAPIPKGFSDPVPTLTSLHPSPGGSV